MNLQRTCRVVINLELPWNPMRLEQRIGRIDRIGQRRSVHAVHLVAAGTRELGMVERLEQRISRASKDIGVPDPLGTFSGLGDLDLPTVRVDASHEHRRLVDARRLAGALPGADAPGPEADAFITTARARLRTRVGAKSLAILQSMLADDNGRPVARCVHGLLLSLCRPTVHGSKAEIRALLDAIGAASRALVADADPWAEAAAGVHAAFWTRRIERERSIRQMLMARVDRPRQPGLFWVGESDGTPPVPAPVGIDPDGTYVQAAERSSSIKPASTVVVLLLLVP
ncbi:MAG: hypothetical protein GEU82_07865 [Luteitalea sp.]|nr:hypothetical protein [Luteitalea sp.]